MILIKCYVVASANNVCINMIILCDYSIVNGISCLISTVIKVAFVVSFATIVVIAIAVRIP